jgi:hypothetical protein
MSRWFAFVRFAWASGALLVIVLTIVFGWVIARTILTQSVTQLAWIVRTAFWMGSSWVILFACIQGYRTWTVGGVSFDSNTWLMAAIITAESSALGFLAFQSRLRLLVIIPLVFGLHLLFPILKRAVFRFIS